MTIADLGSLPSVRLLARELEMREADEALYDRVVTNERRPFPGRRRGCLVPMNATEILRWCADNGVVLQEADGQLKVQAAPGVLDPERIAALRQHKPELLAWLRERSRHRRQDDLDPIPTDAQARRWPLSLAQERLWTQWRLDESAREQLVVAAYRLRGEVDPQRLQRAWMRLVERHAMLRTVFAEDAQGHPEQRLATSSGAWVVHPGVEGDALDDALHAWCAPPFDLGSAPPWRCGVWPQPDGIVVAIVMHHIITDGWSQHLLLSQWQQAYADDLPEATRQHPVPTPDCTTATSPVAAHAPVRWRPRAVVGLVASAARRPAGPATAAGRRTRHAAWRIVQPAATRDRCRRHAPPARARPQPRHDAVRRG